MISPASCSLYLAAFACICLGLVLGVVAVFRIGASRGRLRGYGHAILAILFSTVAMFGLVIVMFTVRGDGPHADGSRRWSTESDGYQALVTSAPPDDWVNPEHTTRTIRGPAAPGANRMKPEDAAELERIVRRTEFEGFDARRVVEMTIRSCRDKTTDVPIVIWIAKLNRNLDPTDTHYTRTGSRGGFVKWGRTLVGIYSEAPQQGAECVKGLTRYYLERLTGGVVVR